MQVLGLSSSGDPHGHRVRFRIVWATIGPRGAPAARGSSGLERAPAMTSRGFVGPLPRSFRDRPGAPERCDDHRTPAEPHRGLVRLRAGDIERAQPSSPCATATTAHDRSTTTKNGQTNPTHGPLNREPANDPSRRAQPPRTNHHTTTPTHQGGPPASTTRATNSPGHLCIGNARDVQGTPRTTAAHRRSCRPTNWAPPRF